MATASEAAPSGETEAGALASIVRWSADLPAWQRDAIRRLCERDALSDEDIDELLALCMGNGVPEPVTTEHIRDPGAALATVTLRAIHSVQHVNAIVQNQRLGFDKIGITVIYGDNGSGKSGYVRVLKKVCRARTSGREEVIHANVYDPNPGTACAVIDFTSNGQNASAPWEDGHPSNSLLSAISVFDARTANVHVNQVNDVAYTPFPLKVLAGLAEACQAIKRRLDKDVAGLRPQTPLAISDPRCRPTTAVGKLISSLSKDTPRAKVEELAMLSAAERKRLDQLNGDLAADPTKTAGRLIAIKGKLDSYAAQLGALAGAVSDETTSVLRDLAAKLEIARAASASASTALFADEPLPEIGSDVWRALWEAARSYSEEQGYPHQQFPVTTEGAVCILCQQDLSSAAADRLNRFEAFVKDESKRREEEANGKYRRSLDDFRSAELSRGEIAAMVACLRDELGDDVLGKAVRRSALIMLRRHRQIARHHASTGFLNYAAPIPPPIAEMETQSCDLASRAAGLTADAGSEARLQLVRERDELADRVWLEGIKSDVVAEIERKKKIAQLELAAKKTATTRITSKSTEIAQQLVTNALRSQFAKEVARLEVGTLAVELKQDHSTYGIPRFRVALTRKPDASVGEVLSEGEHRAVALAAFAAELATTDTRSAIVFDDPVSSLDHMHRDAVAKRLAAEGTHRQVIVFTHDIVFLFMLDEACRAFDPPVHLAIRSLSRGEDLAGYCNDNPPMRARPLKQVITGMQAKLDNERRHFEGNQSEWEATVRALQEQLRTTWERAVEEVISPVLRRLSHKVNTPGLAKLTAVKLDDCNVMREAYGRCSALLHSEAVGLNKPLPHPDKVQAEITALLKWIEDLQLRQSAIGPV